MDVTDVEERTIGLDRRRHEHEGEEDSITVCTHSEDEATRKKEERAERRNWGILTAEQYMGIAIHVLTKNATETRTS